MVWSLATGWSKARAALSNLLAPAPFGTAVVRDDVWEAFQTYPTESSMSAVARFPWVRAAFRAKAMDIAGLPLIAIRTDPRTGERTRVPDHPIPRVFKRVSRGHGGCLTRLQFVLDWQLTGNGYLYQISPELGMDSPIVRLHPNSVRVFSDEWGFIVGYRYSLMDGRQVDLNPEQVIHVRDLSWEDGIASVLGTGAIMALHHDLTANLSVKEMTAKAAKRGRLEMMFSPKEGGLSKEAAERMRDDFETNRRQGFAAFVSGKGMDATPLGLSPRDMEFDRQDENTTAGILGVAGVVPVRVGMPTANYGTSKQQQRNFWEAIRAEVTLIDEQLSSLDPDPNVRIEHDFTAVEALQVSYTERQTRARGWWEMGATAKQAAEYEGFVDAPLGDDLFADQSGGAFRPSAQEPEEGQERSVVNALADYLAGAAKRYQDRHIDAEAFVSATDEEAIRLLAVLERLGVPDPELAGDIARVNDEAVRQLVMRSPGAIRIDVDQSPAFSLSRAVALSTRHQFRSAA